MSDRENTVLKSEIRSGVYYDSIVLMQLQSALKGLPGVADSAVAMATETNLSLLAANGLLPAAVAAAAQGPEDMVVVVAGESEEAAADALGRVDQLLARRRGGARGAYRPKSLESGSKSLPEARWVLVSVPGRYAAAVAEDALDLGRHVFLYSDNVALADEAALKRKARDKGLLVMGPDCGTALIGGVGLGFANRVRRGAIGLVGASGTGLQAISSRIHALGEGVSHAVGTGGRDLSAAVGAVTARQGLELLARDPETRVIVLVSKPPATAVATELLGVARGLEKPVVVDFLGYSLPVGRLGPLTFATSLAEAAELAVDLVADEGREALESDEPPIAGYLRGLFSGGTLAHEALQGLRAFLSPLASNVGVEGIEPLADPAESRGHTVVDLGADELTVGRLHPMIDPDHCVRRLRQEAADPEAGLVLLDVVLGDGAHRDPAGALASAIADACRRLEVIAVVVGTDEDPQGLDEQVERLAGAGATVFRDLNSAVHHVVDRLGLAPVEAFPAVDLTDLRPPVAALNVGLESFYDSLVAQGAEAVHVDWRPPAGGKEKLQAILRKMKGS